MLPFKSIIRLDRELKTPLYLQITSEFIRNITAGILVSTLKLPGTRKLASLLAVHRRTIVAAYEELEAQGWINIKPNKGCFVSEKLPLVASNSASLPASTAHKNAHFPVASKLSHLIPQDIPPKRAYSIAIDDGYPDVRMAPLKKLAKNLGFILSSSMGPSLMTYNQAYCGDIKLREALLTHLKETRGITATTDNILITRGSLMGFYLLFQTLLREGDHVIVGNPGFNEGYNTIRLAGGRLVQIPVDENGMDINAVEAACQQHKIRAVYIIPHHHYPTTVALSAPRRMQLLSLAAEYKFAIIEDDYDYDFHYASSPILPIASSDYAGNVIYVGSLSKIIAPSLRIGFLVGPADLVRELSTLSQHIDSFGNTALERAVAMLFSEGDVDRHIRKAVRTYKGRRNLFCRLLEDRLGDSVTFKTPEGGMAVWVHFIKKYPVDAIIDQALKLGLRVPGKDFFNAPNDSINALRLGFASLNEKEIEQTISLLSQSLSS